MKVCSPATPVWFAHSAGPGHLLNILYGVAALGGEPEGEPSTPWSCLTQPAPSTGEVTTQKRALEARLEEALCGGHAEADRSSAGRESSECRR